MDIKDTDLAAVQAALKEIGAGWETVRTLPGQVKEQQDTILGLRKTLDDFRRGQVAAKAGALRRRGCVSEDVAAHIGAITILGAARANKLPTDRREPLLGRACEILGIEQRAALTSSDIPLPTLYEGQVAELVSEYGTARQYGTVFPLGSGTVKLPKLGTDTAFGLIAGSATVTEKSPTVTFVTFTASKWGGLVRIPSELDADSIVPIGQFIARYAARQLAKIEDTVFWSGDGTATYDSLSGLAFSTITNGKVSQLSGGKTAYSDSVLADWRAVRAVVDEAALRDGVYYCHTSFESLLAGFNTTTKQPYQAMGTAGPTLDGFPVRWIPTMPALSTSANAAKVFALFGDASWQYLGVRGGPVIDTSREVFFATDELAIRALERFTIGLMATGAVAGLETAAA